MLASNHSQTNFYMVSTVFDRKNKSPSTAYGDFCKDVMNSLLIENDRFHKGEILATDNVERKAFFACDDNVMRMTGGPVADNNKECKILATAEEIKQAIKTNDINLSRLVEYPLKAPMTQAAYVLAKTARDRSILDHAVIVPDGTIGAFGTSDQCENPQIEGGCLRVYTPPPRNLLKMWADTGLNMVDIVVDRVAGHPKSIDKAPQISHLGL